MAAHLLARARADAVPRFASLRYHAVTVPRWFGPVERPLLGWLSLPAGEPGGDDPGGPEAEPGAGGLLVPAGGVVICPPIAYEHWCAHASLRELAESLAAGGVAALRFDYDGTGDSAGDHWDPGRVGAWRASVRHAVALLDSLGVRRIALAGLRLGATLAVLEAGACGVDAVACWAPVTSGRRYRRELELLGVPVPSEDRRAPAHGGTVLAGFGLAPETLEDLSRLDVRTLERAPAEVLVLDRPERPDGAALAEQLRGPRSHVEHLVRPGTEAFLDVPVEDGEVPGELIGLLSAWLLQRVAGRDSDAGAGPAAHGTGGGGAGGGGTGGRGADAGGGRTAVTIPWAGGEVLEEVCAIGHTHHAAVRTSPARGDALATVVFLNSGSEPHIGPGRAWVEYARHLALRGIAAVRVDFPGWGETPGLAAGRPYDETSLDSTVELLRSLRARGEGPIVLAGLCAGAWVALKAVLEEPAAGVVAINPQLYFEQGDPVEALLKDTRERRAPLRRREELGRRTGWWTACDLVGLRNVQGRWLDALIRRDTRVLLLFAEGDDGIEYLRNRLRRRLGAALASERFELLEIPGIDHAMHREWRRPAVVDAIAGFVERIAGVSTGGGAA
jgi:alpha-beta hydrolase superfamily lysophospholipase